mmetsp:Transcript_8811/g.11215  ORF Transcript_8811/g.11215 Transcript_8811/m.11215 type:complete len:236 (-) Transcript_8811:256-963(-)
MASSVSKKVVILNTSAAYFGKDLEYRTGVWLEECATPYLLFKAEGFEVVLASTKGGPIPIDAASLGEGFFTQAAKDFMHDAEAMDQMSHSVELANIEGGICEDFDCLYLSGGHGTCTDFVDNPTVKSCIEKMYAAGKVVAADCHGPIALAQCVKPDGTALVAGLEVTGFSNSEEAAVGKTDDVPFLIEDKFVEQGGVYSKGDDWNPKAMKSGNLITGQNPQSSEACAGLVIEALK